MRDGCFGTPCMYILSAVLPKRSSYRKHICIALRHRHHKMSEEGVYRIPLKSWSLPCPWCISVYGLSISPYCIPALPNPPEPTACQPGYDNTLFIIVSRPSHEILPSCCGGHFIISVKLNIASFTCCGCLQSNNPALPWPFLILHKSIAAACIYM